jgi:hypothetical protein
MLPDEIGNMALDKPSRPRARSGCGASRLGPIVAVRVSSGSWDARAAATSLARIPSMQASAKDLDGSARIKVGVDTPEGSSAARLT